MGYFSMNYIYLEVRLIFLVMLKLLFLLEVLNTLLKWKLFI